MERETLGMYALCQIYLEVARDILCDFNHFHGDITRYTSKMLARLGEVECRRKFQVLLKGSP